MISVDGKFRYANPACERIIGAKLSDAPLEEWVQRYGAYYGVYIRVSVRPLIDDGSGIRGAVTVFRDVTPCVFAAEALAQAFAEGRLEIVDTLVHNISNAITSVATGVETLRQALVSAHRYDPRGRSVHADSIAS